MCNIKVMREQYACSAGKSSPQRKRHNFVFRSVDTHSISSDLILANCQTTAPGAEFLKFLIKKMMKIIIQKTQGKLVKRGMPISPEAPPT